MTIQQHVDENYTAFKEQLPTLVSTYTGKFALLRDRQIVEFFDTERAAFVAGNKLFKDDLHFSVQEVISTAADSGFYSDAVPQW